MRFWILFRDAPMTYGIRRLVEECGRRGIDATVVSPSMFDMVVTRHPTRAIFFKGQPVELPDACMVRLGATSTYLGHCIVTELVRTGLPTVNGAEAVRIASDKLASHQRLALSRLPTPDTMLLRRPVDIGLVGRELGFPVVVKTVSGSKGAGVTLCQDENALADLVDMLVSSGASGELILQTFVQESAGRDIRAIVVGNEVIAAMERFSAKSFKSNFSRGGDVRPVEITAELRDLAVASARVLGLDIAGVDLLFGKDRLLVCEVNSAPGFEGMERCHPGLNVPAALLDYLIRRVEEREMAAS